MLALSIKQPWAELLITGAKKIEVRTWLPPDKFLGQTIAIHTGKKIDTFFENEVNFNKLFPELTLSWISGRVGGIIGTAKLIDFSPFTQAGWINSQPQHRNPLEWWQEGLCAWFLAEPVRYSYIIPYPGKLGFFEFIQPAKQPSGPQLSLLDLSSKENAKT